MADLKCEKCEREFKHQKRLETHQEKCEGPKERKTRGAGDGSAEETPDLPMPRPKKKAKVGPIDSALDLLYAKRDELIRKNPELDSVMNAIRALEEIKA